MVAKIATMSFALYCPPPSHSEPLCFMNCLGDRTHVLSLGISSNKFSVICPRSDLSRIKQIDVNYCVAVFLIPEFLMPQPSNNNTKSDVIWHGNPFLLAVVNEYHCAVTVPCFTQGQIYFCHVTLGRESRGWPTKSFRIANEIERT